METLFGIALRITIVYFYILLMLRLAGKRSIDSLTAFDFLVGLMIAEMFDDVVWAEVPLAQGLVASSTIMLLHSLVAFASYKNDRIDALVSATPTTIIQDGRLLPQRLQQERTSAATIEMEMRLRQEDKLEEVKEGRLEPSGELSMEKYFHAKPLQKRDVTAVRKAA
jgi:uncharacterized membrane protein YcaP (DUF421 family)